MNALSKVSSQEQGFFDNAADVTGNVIGSLVNPVVAPTIAEGGEGLLSSVVADTGTIGARAATAATNSGLLTAGTIPSDVVDNFNQKTNSIGWGGVAKDAGINFGIGMAIPAIPFAAGIVKSKLADIAEGKATQEALDNAVSGGALTQDEANFLSAYNARKNPDDLQAMAQKIIADGDDSIHVDENGAHVSILSPDDIKNIQTTGLDELSANVPGDLKNALSDFITNKSLYNVVSNKTIMDGLQGFVDDANEKLGNIDKTLDFATQQTRKRGMKNIPIEKEDSIRMLVDNAKDSPESQPDYVRELAQQKRRGEPVEYPSVSQEVKNLEGTLSHDGYQRTLDNIPEINRLQTLAKYNKNALALYRKVALTNAAAHQQYYADLAQKILDYGNSDMGNLAKTQNVSDYAKARLDQKLAGERVNEPEESATPSIALRFALFERSWMF